MSGILQEICLFSIRDLGSLLDGERQLFSGGESSLFMINARESSFISARVQLVELLVENQKANLSARYILGILGNL
jgi:orotate phosphoribosyltransferase